MTEISVASPNKEEQEQNITIKEFFKTQKQNIENMQLMFQKNTTATSTTQSSRPYRSRNDEKDYHDVSQQESYDRDMHKQIPGASRKRKRVNQFSQTSKDTVTLRPSDPDSYLSEDSTCQRNDSLDPLSKYSRVDSGVEVGGGDQDDLHKDLLASVQEDFGPPTETKLADVLEKIWGKAKLGDSQKEEPKNMLIPENWPFMNTSLLNPEIYNKVNDFAISRDKGAQRKQRLLVKSTIPLIKVVVAFKGLKHDAQDKISKDIIRKLQDASPFLHKSVNDVKDSSRENAAFG